MKLCDVFNLLMVSNRFYHIARANKKFTSAMTFSKHILNFGTDYFHFLKRQLWELGKEVRKKLAERIVRHTFVLTLIDIYLENIVDDLLPLKILCHCFFCVTGSNTAGKSGVCSRFYVDDLDIVSKKDQGFLLSNNCLQRLPICELMEQVNTRSVVLNLYYLVGEYAGNGKWTKNVGEIFFEITNNPFGVCISTCRYIWEGFLIS